MLIMLTELKITKRKKRTESCAEEEVAIIAASTVLRILSLSQKSIHV